MKPVSMRQTPSQTIDKKSATQRVLSSQDMLPYIAEFLPTAQCRVSRGVSFSWYRILDNVIARRALGTLPLYRRDAPLHPMIERQRSLLAPLPQASSNGAEGHGQDRNDALPAASQQASPPPTDLPEQVELTAEELARRAPRLLDFKRTQLPSLLKEVDLHRAATWRQLDLLKHRLWEVCRAMKLDASLCAHRPAHEETLNSNPAMKRVDVPWYFRRLHPDMPSPVSLCLEIHAICRRLYPSEDSSYLEMYREHREFGITPLPRHVNLTFIEQLIDHAQRIPQAIGPWALDNLSAEQQQNATLRPTPIDDEPDWALLAYLGHEQASEELALFKRMARVDPGNCLNGEVLDWMMETDFIPYAYELLRFSRTPVPAHHAPAIFDRAIESKDWEMVQRMVDTTFLTASASRRAQLVQALASSPVPRCSLQQAAMAQVFKVLEKASPFLTFGEPGRALHTFCLQVLTQPARSGHPLDNKVLEWNRIGTQLRSVFGKWNGREYFPHRIAGPLNDAICRGVQIAEPVLMHMLAALDDVSLYRQAVRQGLLTGRNEYSAAPHAGAPGSLKFMQESPTPLHTVLQRDAVQLFIETVDPAYLFEGKRLCLDGKEETLDACAKHVNATKIGEFLRSGAIPDKFASPVRAQAFVHSILSAHASEHGRADTPKPTVDTLSFLQEPIRALLQLPSLHASDLAASLLRSITIPKAGDTEGIRYAALTLRNLWADALNPALSEAQQKMLCQVIRETAYRLKVSFGQAEFSDFVHPIAEAPKMFAMLIALEMPYAARAILKPADVVPHLLPHCVGKNARHTQSNYAIMKLAAEKSHLFNHTTPFDVHACALLLNAEIGSTRPRGVFDPHPVTARLKTHLMPLFTASSETAAAYEKELRACVAKWLAVPSEPTKAKRHVLRAVREKVTARLQQVIRLQLPIRKLEPLFRAVCIADQPELLDEIFALKKLDLRALSDTAVRQDWNCFEIMVEYGARHIFSHLTKKQPLPQKWLELSAQRLEHALCRNQKYGPAILNKALESIPRDELGRFFIGMLLSGQKYFSTEDSALYSILRHHANDRADKLTSEELNRLAKLASERGAYNAYYVIKAVAQAGSTTGSTTGS